MAPLSTFQQRLGSLGPLVRRENQWMAQQDRLAHHMGCPATRRLHRPISSLSDQRQGLAATRSGLMTSAFLAKHLVHPCIVLTLCVPSQPKAAWAQTHVANEGTCSV